MLPRKRGTRLVGIIVAIRFWKGGAKRGIVAKMKEKSRIFAPLSRTGTYTRNEERWRLSPGKRISCQEFPLVPSSAGVAGWINEVTSNDKKLVIRGWGRWQPALEGRHLMIYTNLAVERASVNIVERLDVVNTFKDPRLANSGFVLRLSLDDTKPQPEHDIICLWTDDLVFGMKRISDWAKCHEDGARSTKGDNHQTSQ